MSAFEVNVNCVMVRIQLPYRSSGSDFSHSSTNIHKRARRFGAQPTVAKRTTARKNKTGKSKTLFVTSRQISSAEYLFLVVLLPFPLGAIGSADIEPAPSLFAVDLRVIDGYVSELSKQLFRCPGAKKMRPEKRGNCRHRKFRK